jgi:hypothetical protein
VELLHEVLLSPGILLIAQQGFDCLVIMRRVATIQTKEPDKTFNCENATQLRETTVSRRLKSPLKVICEGIRRLVQ